MWAVASFGTEYQVPVLAPAAIAVVLKGLQVTCRYCSLDPAVNVRTAQTCLPCRRQDHVTRNTVQQWLTGAG